MELGEDVGKVPLLILQYYHAPVPILDIKFGEQDWTPRASVVVAMAKMRQGRTLPSSAIESVGANVGLVASLMDGCHVPMMVTPWERSRIMRKP